MKYNCPKCKGSGYVPFKHIQNGICFDCNGKGYVSYKPNEKRISALKSSLKNLEEKQAYYENKFMKILQAGSVAAEKGNEEEREKYAKQSNEIAKELLYYNDKIKEFKETIEREERRF